MNSLKLRRSIYAVKEIKKGEKFTRKNIRSFRPKIGIGAEKFVKILGKIAKKKIAKDSPISQIL